MKLAGHDEKVYSQYITLGFGKSYSCTPKDYELYYRYFSRNYNRYLPPAKDAQILELGCGKGHFLYYLKKRGYNNHVGIDLSPECVEHCVSRGFHAVEADAFEYLSDKSEHFDAIVANEFFEHLEKSRAFEMASLCHQALREGGVLIIKVPNMACPLVGCRGRYVDITHEMGYTHHSLRTLLLMCGFAEVDCFGPDIYVTRNPLANLAGKALFYVVTAVFRGLYYLYGVRTRTVMRMKVVAVARKLRK